MVNWILGKGLFCGSMRVGVGGGGESNGYIDAAGSKPVSVGRWGERTTGRSLVEVRRGECAW